MRREVDNRNKDCEFNGPYAGRDMYITMYQDSEREFVVTHNADIKPVSYFTGRETELEDLRQRIEDGRKSVLVSGMGGIGKTQICRKLFEEYEIKNRKGENESFSHIGYIEYNVDMNSSLQKCLRYKKQENPELNKEAAWKELESLASDGKLLLFVDNVNVTVEDDPSLERLKQLPGAIVLTSRRTSFSTEFERFRIGFLNKEQCREIYEKIRFEDSRIGIKKEEVPDLEYIIEELAATHTITVEHLAHLARANGWTVKTLRDQLERKGFQLEYVNDEEKLINIQKSYEALYDLSQLTAAEQNILEAFSVFPYIPLKKEICNQWLLADAGVSEEENVLFRLYRKGWLQSDVEQESYSLHPVFAKFINEKSRPEFNKHIGLIKACERYLKVPDNGSPMECQRFIPFAESIIKRVNMRDDLEQAEIIVALANLFQYIAEYGKASGLYEKVLGICERLLGENHPDTAASYYNLGNVYARQGEYGKAEGLYEQSLAIRERLLGEDHPDTAASYNNLAGVYVSQGEYWKAKRLCEKSLVIRERLLGENHPSTSISYNNLAYVYASQEKYEEAEELCAKSLAIRKRLVGGEHPSTAASYNNLAYIYARQGEFEIALAHYQKAYKIFLLRLGKNHPKIQKVYGSMKIIYLEFNPEGDFDQWLEEKMKGSDLD